MSYLPGEIQLAEKRKIQMEMLDEIHDFCVKHHIRYSLAFGTLLGAIRHKGFIPWDDDMDIMMPYSDLQVFKQTFQSKNIRISDLDSNKDYQFAFPRLVHTHTYSKQGKGFIGDGICIDVYPMVSLPENRTSIKWFMAWAIFLRKIRRYLMALRTRVRRRFSTIKDFPINRFFQKRYRAFLYGHPFKEEGYFLVAGGLGKRFIFYENLFSHMEEAPFEDHTYSIISSYDLFLTTRYGDYMKLPPVEEQKPTHQGHYYWKDEQAKK